ncbi:uncharacterized protein LOC110628466 isoform X2 [Manihot esculenta]|uniref:uncharacterized protein LOC110628466 isoform X2 n=1 Tax=Manihot esculenta TaxID=3983 RepID=UPI001CC48218|nr:uncharacterized protein LOC110628466 isoform X2 [Manihot esculenta]
MAEVPSLMSLGMEAIKRQLLWGDDVLPDIYELPSHIFDSLVTELPPLALHKLEAEMPYKNWDDYECTDGCPEIGTKRGRSGNFSKAWKLLFKQRWPQLVDHPEPVNWQQIYWQTHLQNCLDEAAALASIPSFDGCIGKMKVSDNIMICIGCGGHLNHSIYSMLSYHFEQFGHYARFLRLPNVLCVAETCVDGLCQLLIQNIETLTSLEFIHCKLSSTFVNAICGCLEIKGKETHIIQNFSIRTSNFLENNAVSFPQSFVSFLSSGRSLCSLRFCDNNLDRYFAQMLFTILINASSSISTLDLSDNSIAGWLSNFNRGSSSRLPSSLGTFKSLQSLHELNLRTLSACGNFPPPFNLGHNGYILIYEAIIYNIAHGVFHILWKSLSCFRGNNLHKYDVESLRNALFLMPNLEVLDLSDNPIEDEGIRCLIPYFVEAPERCSPLAVLNLEDCELSWNGVTQLLDTLSTLKRPLRSLTLADNGLGSLVAGSLGKFLATSITELNIGGIGLGSAGFLELQKGMTVELKLVKINISKNRGGLETARFLSKLMSSAPDLVVVNASYNLMPEETLTIICSALKAAKGNLQSLDLTGNMWDCQQTYASVLAEFQHNGRPILILPSAYAPDVPYDDDP